MPISAIGCEAVRLGAAWQNIFETTKTNDNVDFSHRDFLLGGAGFATGLLLFGRRSSTMKNQNSPNNRSIGIDGRDYTVAPPQIYKF